MTRFNRFLLGAASLVALTGCSDDITGPGDNGGVNGENGGDLYIGINLTMPGMGGSTRSWTDGDNSSNDGVEIGSNIENNVNEVLLVLARANDNGFIAASTVSKQNLFVANNPNDATGKIYNATAQFYKTEFEEYYNDQTAANPNGGARLVHVFVFCNPNQEIVTSLRGCEYGDTHWTDTGCKVTVNGQTTEGSIWSSTNGGMFLMTNSSIAEREVPATIDSWDNYTSREKCFNLSGENTKNGNTIDNGTQERGAVKVERAAARIDFRDGSPDPKDNPNTYPVMMVRGEDNKETSTPVISVELNKMALVNMSNQFYYLPRVSPNGKKEGSVLCGAEKPWFTDAAGNLAGTPGNYVVDFYAGDYTLPLESGFSTYFNYPFFNADGKVDNANLSIDGDRWGTVRIADVLKGSKDNWDNNGKTGTYNVWRYLTEHTISGVAENQQYGISTGVVFKAKMKANADLLTNPDTDEQTKQLINTINDTRDSKLGDTDKDPILYQLDGLLYVTWENVRDAAIKASFSWHYGTDNEIIPEWNRSNSLYEAVFGKGGTGYTLTVTVNGEEKTYTDPLELDSKSANAAWNAWNNANKPASGTDLNKAFKKAVTDAGFTLYQSSYDADNGWGYYCYYYHWIRHNDNGNNGVMGPMEFAIVRNNVYKLSVSKIHTLGHPRISENDPNAPEPDDPDEETKIYLTVDTEVIPWVVRVNEVVFE